MNRFAKAATAIACASLALVPLAAGAQTYTPSAQVFWLGNEVRAPVQARKVAANENLDPSLRMVGIYDPATGAIWNPSAGGGGGTDPLARTPRAYTWASGQKLTVGSTSVQSTAISASEVTLAATTDMFIVVGANPTASNAAGALPLLAGEKFTLQITSGQKIAAIRSVADGALFIMPVAP